MSMPVERELMFNFFLYCWRRYSVVSCVGELELTVGNLREVEQYSSSQSILLILWRMKM